MSANTKSLTAGHKAGLILALSVAASACAPLAAAPDIPTPDALYTLLLNGRVVHVGEGSVLDLLNNRYGGNVAQAYASAFQDEPLVLLDLVRLDGVYRLADVPAFHAEGGRRNQVGGLEEESRRAHARPSILAGRCEGTTAVL